MWAQHLPPSGSMSEVRSGKNRKIFVTFVQSLKAYNYNNKLRTCVDQTNISLNFIKEVQKTSVVSLICGNLVHYSYGQSKNVSKCIMKTR